jgi:thiol:disulfide interchange protein DsbD
MRLLAVLALYPAIALAQLPPGLPGFGGPKATKFEDVADVTVKIEPAQAKPGDTVKLYVTVTPEPGAWTYALAQPKGQPEKMTILPPKTAAITFAGPTADPDGWKEKDGVEPGSKERYYPDPVTWVFTGTVNAVPPGKATLDWKGTRIQACNHDNCFNLYGTKMPAAELEVLAGPGGTPPPPKAVEPPPATAPAKADPPASPPANTAAPKRADLFQSMLLAAGWGLISLVTPCVFPMIPITVSLFLKQSQNNAVEAVKQAGVYCLTIIVMLGVPTVFLLSSFSKLSIDPFMNVFLAGLFVFFAISLFGAYEATIRATFWFVSVFGGAVALASAVSTQLAVNAGTLDAAAEGGGLIGRWVSVGVFLAIAVALFATRKPGSQDGLVKFADAKRKAGGILGTVFGAMLFSIISFTCVAPFLGAFAGLVSTEYKGRELELIPVGLAFSTAFASPFFVLALFPSLMKKLPRSGGWLDIVKAVMGFIELAAAFKFARTAEVRWLDPVQYFTYSVCLTAFVAISVVCGLYLLGVFRLPHDEDERTKLSVPRLLFALGFLGFGIYLTPGLFRTESGENQRPQGVVFAWVDSFLLPDATPPKPATDGGKAKGETWSRDLEATKREVAGRVRAWEAEKAKNPAAPPPDQRLIFIDFTGVTCSNCKLNERNVFPMPEVAGLLKQYAGVQLYTDTVPASLYTGTVPTLEERTTEAGRNREYQVSEYGTEQLPLYVILKVNADGTTTKLGQYEEGKINNVGAFVEFLRKPLEGK